MENNRKEDNSITLSDILRVVWKNIILICSVTAVVTVAVIVYVFGFVKETFKAETSVLVAVDNSVTSEQGEIKYNIDYSNTLRVVSTVGNEMIYSDYVIDKVNAKFPELSKDTLRANTKASVSTSSYVVTITYVDGDKDRAVKVANEISSVLEEYVDSNEAVKAFKLKVSTTNKAEKAVHNSPNEKLYIIVAFIGGLVLSLVIVFLKEFMSSKFKTKDEVESVLNKDVIGVLPNIVKGKAENELVPAPKTIQEFEPYNKLLSAIEYYNLENPYKAIMFTSTGEDELKTTTIFKLAYTITNNEKKVIILDLDIRKPVIHKYFNVPKKDGVVDYLKGNLKKEEIIKHTESGVDIITGGENIINPIVLLKNEKLAELIKELKEEYDYILVDTPPATGITDATLVSSFVDGVVYNVAMNQARKKVAKETIKQLETAGAKIIGVNITKAEIGRSNYYYQYYNYNYGNDEKENA